MRKPRAENRWIEKYKVKSDSGSVYTVSLAKDGTWGCSCPAWKFAKLERHDCKHIEVVRSIRDTLTTRQPRFIEVAFGPRWDPRPADFTVTVGGLRLVERLVDAPMSTWQIQMNNWSGQTLWECPPFRQANNEKTLVRAVW